MKNGFLHYMGAIKDEPLGKVGPSIKPRYAGESGHKNHEYARATDYRSQDGAQRSNLLFPNVWCLLKAPCTTTDIFNEPSRLKYHNTTTLFLQLPAGAARRLHNVSKNANLYFEMPITSSAKKAHRQSVRRRAHNLQYRHAIKEHLKKVRRFIAQGNAKDAQAALPALYKVLDKSAKEHIIEKNTAARYKSRITKKIAQLDANKG